VGIIRVGFHITDQLLIRLSEFIRYWRKDWEYNETAHQLFIDFQKADSVKKEVLYKKFKLKHGEFGVVKYLSDSFAIQNGIKQEALSPLLFNTPLEYAIRKVQENQVGLKFNGTHQLVAYADDVNLLADHIYTG
jgi:hypothetical protein